MVIKSNRTLEENPFFSAKNIRAVSPAHVSVSERSEVTSRIGKIHFIEELKIVF